MLLPEDEDFLKRKGFEYEVALEEGYVSVTIKNYPLPPGYQEAAADLLVRLPIGFPDASPDMWWCAPAVLLANGGHVTNTEVTEVRHGRTWQRWSRHFIQGATWSYGRSGLESYLTLIMSDFAKWVRAA